MKMTYDDLLNIEIWIVIGLTKRKVKIRNENF